MSGEISGGVGLSTGPSAAVRSLGGRQRTLTTAMEVKRVDTAQYYH